jgi:hypothetical protein
MPGRPVPWQRLAAARLLEQDSAHQRTVYRCRRFHAVTEPICHRSTAEPKGSAASRHNLWVTSRQRVDLVGEFNGALQTGG